MKHSRNLNYEQTKQTNRQDTTHIIPSTLRLLGTVRYTDMPTIWSI